jgi:hypothetical protein
MHRLFPYLPLKGRTPDDGAPPSVDPMSLPGFAGPISLEDRHAYRVIDPPADAKEITVDFAIPRAPSRLLRFVDPDGRPVRGVTVRGLLGSTLPSAAIEGSEAEATGLDPAAPREVLALSVDGRFYGRATVPIDPNGPLTIRLEPAGAVAGRLVDGAGRPLVKYGVSLSYAGSGLERDFEPRSQIPRPAAQVTTDAEGRFRVPGVVPGLRGSLTFQEPRPADPLARHEPSAARALVVRPGETRDLGTIKAGPGRR